MGRYVMFTRWIQETYKERFTCPGICYQKLLKRTTDIADIDLPEEEWMEYVYENLSEIRDQRKKKVQEKRPYLRSFLMYSVVKARYNRDKTFEIEKSNKLFIDGKPGTRYKNGMSLWKEYEENILKLRNYP